MGLYVVCKEKDWSCTYSGVHFYREIVIKATLAYVKQIQCGVIDEKSEIECPYQRELRKEKESQQDLKYFEDEKKRLISFLERLLEVKSISDGDNINYKPLQHTDYALYFFGLGGLKDFVYHSDCDGYYTPGQCMNILELYSKICIYLKDMFPNEYQDVEELMEVIRESYETKSYVIFS